MAARSKPHEHRWRVGNQGQHAVGTGPRLEFRRGASGSRGQRGSGTTQPATFRQPAHPFAKSNPQLVVTEPELQPASTEPVLQSPSAERFERKRLWRSWQRCQHATIQQPWLLQPWW